MCMMDAPTVQTPEPPAPAAPPAPPVDLRLKTQARSMGDDRMQRRSGLRRYRNDLTTKTSTGSLGGLNIPT